MNLDSIIEELARYYDMEIKENEKTHFIQGKNGEMKTLKKKDINQIVSFLFEDKDIISEYHSKYENEFIKYEEKIIKFNNKRSFKFDASWNEENEKKRA